MNRSKRIISLAIFLIFFSQIFSISSIQGDSSQASEVYGYPDYSQIENALFQLNSSYSSICALHAIGKTYEGRTIWALKISDNPNVDEDDEPDILIMGEHHAKELISAVIPLMFAESLVHNYSSNPEVREYVDSNEVWVVPVVNPDGYEYAVQGHLDWRKNRRPVDVNGDGVPDGVGVDLNRNYAHHWGEQGVSHDPQSDIYCGPAPFSENETRAIRNLVLSHHFVFSVSFHSYGQIIYYPWGNSIDPPPMDRSLMEAIAKQMSGYNLYRVMEGKETYSTTGDSDDWLYANTSCLPFTIELGKEFVPPPQYINEIFMKNDGALLYLLSISHNPYLALSTDKTNLRIDSFDVNSGNASIIVENQGNYSVSAYVNISAGDARNTTKILLAPHEKEALNMGISCPSCRIYNASIASVHGAQEWNISDNSAVFFVYPPSEDVHNAHYTIYALAAFGLIVLLSTVAYLFKKHKLH